MSDTLNFNDFRHQLDDFLSDKMGNPTTPEKMEEIRDELFNQFLNFTQDYFRITCKDRKEFVSKLTAFLGGEFLSVQLFIKDCVEEHYV